MERANAEPAVISRSGGWSEVSAPPREEKRFLGA